MTTHKKLHRHRDTPHLFCPRIAKKHGLVVAVVEHAIRDLCRGQDPITHEEIPVGFEPLDVAAVCSYLKEEEVLEAVKKLCELEFCVEGKE